jgi:hypothetical protein
LYPVQGFSFNLDTDRQHAMLSSRLSLFPE